MVCIAYCWTSSASILSISVCGWVCIPVQVCVCYGFNLFIFFSSCFFFQFKNSRRPQVPFSTSYFSHNLYEYFFNFSSLADAAISQVVSRHSSCVCVFLRAWWNVSNGAQVTLVSGSVVANQNFRDDRHAVLDDM